MEEVKLSLGLLPDDKNKYIVVDIASGKELIINGGVTLKAIDKNGEVHELGCKLSADYFFRLITNALDDSHKNLMVSSLLKPAWGVGSEFSSVAIKESDAKAHEELMKMFKIKKSGLD